mmetsp:Transcript_15929/g.37568  ORF Transcript_15929/g.37568 Transcript_15929/m.37568 type:complete len:847 (+) Transcript_15929:147-2687(+)
MSLERVISGESTPLLSGGVDASDGGPSRSKNYSGSSKRRVDVADTDLDDAEREYLEEDEEEEEELKKLFPVDILPSQLSFASPFLPVYFYKWQDATHCILVVAFMFMAIYMAGGGFVWFLLDSGKDDRVSARVCLPWEDIGESLRARKLVGTRTEADRCIYCTYRISSIFWYLGLTLYLLKVLTSYDDNMYQKKKELRQKSTEVQEIFDSMVSSLEATLKQYVDSNAGLAERTLESRKRDFMRFLRRLQKEAEKQPKRFQGLEEDFIKFVRLWLRILSECSLEPLRDPKILKYKVDGQERPLQLNDEDLRGHWDVAAVSSIVAECLDQSEINIYSAGVETDKKAVKRLKESFRNQATFLKISQRRRHTMLTKSADDLEAQVALARKNAGLQEDESKSRAYCILCCMCWSLQKIFSASRNGKHKWVHFHRCFSLKLRCIHVVFLSRSHIFLLWSVLIIPLFMAAEMWIFSVNFSQGSPFSRRSLCGQLVGQIASFLAVCGVLYNYVNIDEVQKLEAHLNELQDQEHDLELRRRRLLQFYRSAERQSDVWLHRTIPRFDIMKEMHDAMEDPAEFATILKDSNAKLKDLEEALPPLGTWCNPRPKLRVTVIGASSLRNADAHTLRRMVGQEDLSDPYCKLELLDGSGKAQSTKVISDELNPTWDQPFDFNDYFAPDPIKFTVLDKDFGGADDPLGTCTLKGELFYEEGRWETGWEGSLPLTGSGAKKGSSLQVRVEVTTHVSKELSTKDHCDITEPEEDRYTVPPDARQEIGSCVKTLLEGDFDHRSILKDLPAVSVKVKEVRRRLEDAVPREAETHPAPQEEGGSGRTWFGGADSASGGGQGGSWFGQ